MSKILYRNCWNSEFICTLETNVLFSDETGESAGVANKLNVLLQGKRFLSAVRWIDMISSLVSPVVTIHLDIVFVNRAQTWLATLIVFTGEVLFSILMISYNIPTAAGDSAVLLEGEEQGAFLYLLFCCLIPPPVSAAQRAHGNNTAL